MSRPSWQDALNREPRSSEEKRAVAIQVGPDGRTRVVAAGQGAAADEIIARAEAAGVEVRRDREKVHQLLRAEGEEHSIPPEIYEMMATVINFTQELNELWLTKDLEALE